MVKVTSPAVQNDAILYIPFMSTTPCTPSSNMRNLSYLLLQHAFSQACPSFKLACSGACIEPIHIRLAQYSASGINMAQCCALSINIAQWLWIKHQYGSIFLHHACVIVTHFCASMTQLMLSDINMSGMMCCNNTQGMTEDFWNCVYMIENSGQVWKTTTLDQFI